MASVRNSGLPKLERGDIFFEHPDDPNTNCAVRFYTRLPVTNPSSGSAATQMVVFTMMVTRDRVYSQVVTEPQHATLYGVGEVAPTAVAAAAEAAKMIEFVTKPE